MPDMPEENLDHCPDGLIRKAHTKPQEGTGYKDRFDRQAGTIAVNPKRIQQLAGRPVLLVDDVMTSGATLHEATRAFHDAGIARVNTIVCARVVKNY